MVQKFTIGRNPNNSIVISHPSVSGYHADLIVDDNMGFAQYTFIDHSTNGTMINGQYLKNASCYVVYNDMIVLAGVVAFDWNILNSIQAFVPGVRPANAPFSPVPSHSQTPPRKERMSFGDALKSFFNNYVNFEGRATRREFWFMFLWLIIFSTLLSAISSQAAVSVLDDILSGDWEDVLYSASSLYSLGWSFYLWVVYEIVMFLPSLSLMVRRIHDTGKDGLWILMILVPIANIVFFFIWTLTPSEPRTNKWGDYISVE